MKISIARQQELLLPMPVRDKDKGYICDHCGLFVKRYKRHFNAGMAYTLLMMYLANTNKYIHVEELLKKKNCPSAMRGDFSYLRHYHLIEKKPEKRDDGSPRNGYYKITSFGLMFCEKKVAVKASFVMFNGNCEGLEGKDILITEALGKKFNYDELMGNTKL